MLWKTGIDITVEDPARDEHGNIDFQMNMGEGNITLVDQGVNTGGKRLTVLHVPLRAVGYQEIYLFR